MTTCREVTVGGGAMAGVTGNVCLQLAARLLSEQTMSTKAALLSVLSDDTAMHGGPRRVDERKDHRLGTKSLYVLRRVKRYEAPSGADTVGLVRRGTLELI